MSVMVTDVDTSKDRMTELEKKVNMLMKAVEERDFEIALLKNHIESRDAAESSHTHTIKNVNKGKAIMQESQPQNSTSIASLSVQQLQKMIANSIKTQYGGPAKTHPSFNSSMERAIQNNMLLISSKLVKLLVHEEIWTSSLFELSKETPSTGTPTWSLNPLIVGSNLKGTFSTVSKAPDGIKPRTFEELATRARDMELSIANRGNNDLLVPEVRKEKKEVKST
ncbi:ty3-gypsy retrotransposon protein [Cucumis melo var. makuwa]|uniref:Ty3-gypsy retrotransposon protein n=1 Tax=Cucumis melo var. makuwa TaxID=1194695 RepID=A0A5D3D5V7_CUCMM|nr:ty3-gypsy retrotransposon protein [Cucumis melo var. makuwa]TYK18948.1 ty3-gypsy retrotransposon protein [Cucumis melo var. makuwa]